MCCWSEKPEADSRWNASMVSLQTTIGWKLSSAKIRFRIYLAKCRGDQPSRRNFAPVQYLCRTPGPSRWFVASKLAPAPPRAPARCRYGPKASSLSLTPFGISQGTAPSKSLTPHPFLPSLAKSSFRRHPESYAGDCPRPNSASSPP